jgi:short subunit dehydrogenase-like uncharacterized protein
MADRNYDVVVLGATGFTGRLVAEVMAQRAMEHPFRWAIAGRSDEKLAGVEAALPEGGRPTDRIVADSHDRASLDAITEQSRVVLTTVGPYAKHGEELVASCVERGAHYCDLTGEVPFIRRMIDRHHDAAREAGVRVVHCCGFDSIPSDLGTLALQEALIARDGTPAEAVKLFVLGARGGVSGGTVASLLNMLEQASDPAVRRILGHPYALNPEGERRGPDGRDAFGPARDPVTGWWTGPFVMAAINTRVVRRSNALLDYRYGREFRYAEVTRFKGWTGMLGSTAFSGAYGAFLAAALWRPTRTLLTRTVLPAPGEGPKPEDIERGFFKLRLSARTGGREVGAVEVRGRRDPGYGATACMISESALCLAQDPLTTPGGVTTPAAAMGSALIDRLQVRDVQFEVES